MTLLSPKQKREKARLDAYNAYRIAKKSDPSLTLLEVWMKIKDEIPYTYSGLRLIVKTFEK